MVQTACGYPRSKRSVREQRGKCVALVTLFEITSARVAFDRIAELPVAMGILSKIGQ